MDERESGAGGLMAKLIDIIGTTSDLSISEAQTVIVQLRGMLDSMPPDKGSGVDVQLRGQIEALLAGYEIGARSR